MAVVPSGFYGDYFNQYTSLSDSRNWNTKNYDFATIKNKGDITADLTNETTVNAVTNTADPATTGTGLFVKTNKYGTLDNLGRFTEDKENPFYVIRDSQDRTDYNYYTDQETGNVYFRPTIGATPSLAATSTVAGVAVNNIRLPNASDIQNYVPQYFGTSFTLDSVPNPESWGQGQTNNLAYIFQNAATLAGLAVPGGSPVAFSEVEINGVKISNNGLDTSLSTAIPSAANIIGTGPAAPLYQFSNAFTTGSSEFNSVQPQERWQAKGAVLSWPGATSPPGGFVASDAMWIADPTDADLLPYGASTVGVQDALFRSKLNLSSLPASPVSLNLGVDSGNVEFFLNGVRYAAAAGVVTLPVAAFKIGDNNFGIHAYGNANNEGVYVSMTTANVQLLGTDLTSSKGSWEAALGYPLAGQNTAIGNVPNEINRLFENNWTYEPPTAIGLPGKYKTSSYSVIEDNGTTKDHLRQSYFNNRTTDNFIMKVDISREAVALNAATAWSGVRIRATNPGDLPEQSGYTVRWNAAGHIELYKANGGMNPALATAIDGSPNVVAVANTAALDATPRTLEVHANGYNIQVLVNGVSVINFNDNPDRYYQEGYSAFASYGNFTAFQNFKLHSYAEPVQLISRALKKGENSIVIKGYAQDNLGNALLGSAAASGTIVGRSINGILTNIDLSTNNIPPSLLTTGAAGTGTPVSKDLMDVDYKASVTEKLTGVYNYALDPSKAYWSASSKSMLGIAGKIQFKNREGADLQQVREQFVGHNNVMQNLSALLGAEDRVFDSHLGIIK